MVIRRRRNTRIRRNFNRPNTLRRLRRPLRRIVRRRPTVRTNTQRPFNRRRKALVATSNTLNAYTSISPARNGVLLASREIFPVYQMDKDSDKATQIMPLCPSKWKGTRTRTIAQTYCNYRPMLAKLNWVPCVPTSTTGTIAVGTTFAGCTLDTNAQLESALPTTNGGFITSIWSRAQSNIAITNCLTQPTYPTQNTNPDDVPAWIYACTQTQLPAKTLLGYLILTTRWRLTNPSVINFNTTYDAIEGQFTKKDDGSYIFTPTVDIDLEPGFYYAKSTTQLADHTDTNSPANLRWGSSIVTQVKQDSTSNKAFLDLGSIGPTTSTTTSIGTMYIFGKAPNFQ